jgi:hypothetical protein
MKRISAFELHIHPGDALASAKVSVAVQRYATDPAGRVLITPECASLDEIEGQINALQDELDELRERARRVFSPFQGPGAIM